MASSIAKLNLKTLNTVRKIYTPFYVSIRNTTREPRPRKFKGTIVNRNLISATTQSLKSRGFLRSLKPYTPPSDIDEKLCKICENVLGETYEKSSQLSDDQKFQLLVTCFKETNHSVPNPKLHTIKKVEDVFEFYNTPVVTTTPYEDLVKADLPPNLHVQEEYVRFHPNTDTMFNGVTAFPYSSTIVTGLKYKKKYKGFTLKSPFYYDNWADYVEAKEKYKL